MASVNIILYVLCVLENISVIGKRTDYCSMESCEGRPHTMCTFFTAGYSLTVSTNGFCIVRHMALHNVDLLRLHNHFRHKVATGHLGKQPSATNMHALSWDPELQEVAVRWGAQCSERGHDQCRDSERFRVGQNIAESSEDLGADLARSWFLEVNNFDPKGVEKFEPKNETEHYTQVVWAKTKFLGCAYVDKGPSVSLRFRLICNYGPVGNVPGEPVYLTGSPGGNCSAGRHHKFQGLCSKASFATYQMQQFISIAATIAVAAVVCNRNGHLR